MEAVSYFSSALCAGIGMYGRAESDQNADGTVTTTKRVVTESRMANYVRGKKIGYINDNTDITLNFHETAEEYLARIEKEQQEEAQYGTLSTHTKYNVDENGNRIWQNMKKNV